jgi:hypothetical protein
MCAIHRFCLSKFKRDWVVATIDEVQHLSKRRVCRAFHRLVQSRHFEKGERGMKLQMGLMGES